MFDYDSLALNVSADFNNHAVASTAPSAMPMKRPIGSEMKQASISSKASFEDNVLRRLSGESNDTFDCSASSGYGSSCTGTPLASPALLPTNFLSHNLQKMLAECDVNDHLGVGSNDHGDLLSFLNEMNLNEQIDESLEKRHYQARAKNTLFTPPNLDLHAVFQQPPPSQPNHSCSTPFSPAVEDGFSADEISQFAQLLCSPKKTPPQHYQCHICFNTGHYISDCPMRFNATHDELTPYQGRKKCYGEFTCGSCKRRWTSQNSVANEAQNCIKCSVPVFPHKQLPVDKAIALGLVKAQRTVPTKLAPIGSGRGSIAVRQ